MKIQNFSVIIEHDKNGFVAECLDLQGCYTQGKTYEEVVKNIRDAIKLHLSDRAARKEKLNAPERSFSLSNFQIAVA
jgi:predicted RNase H-like HicB family nuclease